MISFCTENKQKETQTEQIATVLFIYLFFPIYKYQSQDNKEVTEALVRE